MMKFFPINTYAAAFSMYVLLFTIRRLASSNVQGHSAEEAFQYWWMFGAQTALFLRGLETKSTSTVTPSRSFAGPTRGGPGFRDRLLPGRAPGIPVSARNPHA